MHLRLRIRCKKFTGKGEIKMSVRPETAQAAAEEIKAVFTDLSRRSVIALGCSEGDWTLHLNVGHGLRSEQKDALELQAVQAKFAYHASKAHGGDAYMTLKSA
ncbi:hypothetical protein HY950_00680 [Candidatus Gottesmanbacteria bacterium]|nr:hypothetical protein [Candidatus Gottesmanbacteria bacterium]